MASTGEYKRHTERSRANKNNFMIDQGENGISKLASGTVVKGIMSRPEAVERAQSWRREIVPEALSRGSEE